MMPSNASFKQFREIGLIRSENKQENGFQSFQKLNLTEIVGGTHLQHPCAAGFENDNRSKAFDRVTSGNSNKAGEAESKQGKVKMYFMEIMIRCFLDSQFCATVDTAAAVEIDVLHLRVEQIAEGCTLQQS